MSNKEADMEMSVKIDRENEGAQVCCNERVLGAMDANISTNGEDFAQAGFNESRSETNEVDAMKSLLAENDRLKIENDKLLNTIGCLAQINTALKKKNDELESNDANLRSQLRDEKKSSIDKMELQKRTEKCVSDTEAKIMMQNESIKEEMKKYLSGMKSDIMGQCSVMSARYNRIKMRAKTFRVLCVYPLRSVLGQMTDFRHMLDCSVNLIWVDRKAENQYLNDLMQFDLLIFDLQDSAANDYPFDHCHQAALIEYLKAGKSVLVSHDHFTDGRIVSSEIYKYCGIVHKERNSPIDYSFQSVTIVNNHPIMSSWFNFDKMKSFPVHFTHMSHQQTTDATPILRSESGEDYLTCRIDPNSGARVMVCNAGHSESLSTEEKMLFVNILVWLASTLDE